MANVNAPDGFTPAYHMYGGTIRPARMRIAVELQHQYLVVM